MEMMGRWLWPGMVILAMIGAKADAQLLRFKTYGPSDGIHYPFIYSLNQDETGKLVIGTGEGLYLFNGRTFKLINEKNGLGGDFIQTSLKAKNGVVWFGHNQGSVSSYDGKTIRAYDLSLYTKSRIRQLVEGPDGSIWAITQNDGLIKIQEDGKAKAYYKDFKEVLCFSGAALEDGQLLVGHDSGLWLLKEKPGSEDTFFIREVETPGFGAVRCISEVIQQRGICVVEDEGICQIRINEDKVSLESLEIEGADAWMIENILHLSADNYRLSTHKKSLVNLRLRENLIPEVEFFGLNQRMPEAVQCFLEDREKNLWIGTYGKGLLKVLDTHLSFVEVKTGNEPNEVHTLVEHGRSLWVGTSKALVVYADKGSPSAVVLGNKHRLPKDTITGVAFDNLNQVWVSSARSGLFRASLSDTVFSQVNFAPDRLSRQVRQMALHKDKLAVATASGLFLFDLQTESYNHLTMKDGLPHNAVRSVCPDKEGYFWIATEGGGVVALKKGQIQTVRPSDFMGRNVSITSIAAHRNGHVALATEGIGVVLITGGDTINFTQDEGLYSNYCKAVVFDGPGKIWVSHFGGISVITPSEKKVIALGESDGMGARYLDRSISVGKDGEIRLGSETGFSVFDTKRLIVNSVEPPLQIESMAFGDKLFKVFDNLMMGYGNYKVRIDYIGISHKNPERVTYSHFLEGHDLEWSEPSVVTFAQYGNLGPGTYTFRLKTFNSDGIGGEKEASVRFVIDKPYWKKLWFIGLCVIFGIFLLYVGLKQREHMLIDRQRQLERQLDDKTREIRAQKDLLEIRNKDITDSISYAKNIQKALLPPKGKLNEWLPDSFVFYKPRDIVSGDFFWMEQFNRRLIIACADCTGHGVPGAIMSVLGFGLLREISRNPLVQRTDEALNLLDKELRMVLGRYAGANSVSDGMDMVLLDIHFDTGILNFSAARRPVVIFRKGEMIVFKGDRLSIGGRLDEAEKSFEEQAFLLETGDTVYVFSDGIVDQFGGPEGKKLKTKGFLEFLETIQIHDMSVQQTLLRSFFVRWKGVLPQLDDILIIGFRW